MIYATLAYRLWFEYLNFIFAKSTINLKHFDALMHIECECETF